MNDLRVFQNLTYIECFDGEIRTTTADLQTVQQLLKEEQFINLGNELINKSNIKRVFQKELSDVDKIVYSIEDKIIRAKVQTEIDRRTKEGLRISVGIIENLLSKIQNND